MADWRGSDYYPKLRAAKVDPKELEFFSSEPSTRKWLENPRYDPIITAARIAITDKEDEFLAKTLQTDDTIRNWLALVSNVAFPPPSGATASTEVSRRTPGTLITPEILIFFHLQSGVNGFRETAHGGLLCTLMDEALAMVVELYRATSSSSREELYTARLDIRYRRPVKTPGVVIAKAWLEKREGRRWAVKGVLEDSAGHVCVEVDGLWIAARPRRL
jgi:acyl-coenzyme A thioesterase PaaI-like protein